jgi:hypothetical protein
MCTNPTFGMRETQMHKALSRSLADGDVVHRRTAVEAGRHHKKRLWPGELRWRSGLLRGKQQVCFDEAMSASHSSFPMRKVYQLPVACRRGQA